MFSQESTGGREMHVKTRVALQPVLHFGVLVSCVVIDHQM